MAGGACPVLVDAIHKNSRVDWSDGLISIRFENSRDLLFQYYLTKRYADRYQPTENDTRECSPLDWLLSIERQREVRYAIRQLRPADAEILLLKYAQNWNYHKIAEHLGISHSAVEARLHRARARLRKELVGIQTTEEAK